MLSNPYWQAPSPATIGNTSASPSSTWSPHRMVDQSPAPEPVATINDHSSPPPALVSNSRSSGTLRTLSSEYRAARQATADPTIATSLRATSCTPSRSRLSLRGLAPNLGFDLRRCDIINSVNNQYIPPAPLGNKTLGRSMASGPQRSLSCHSAAPNPATLRAQVSETSSQMMSLATSILGRIEMEQVHEKLVELADQLHEVLIRATELVRLSPEVCKTETTEDPQLSIQAYFDAEHGPDFSGTDLHASSMHLPPPDWDSYQSARRVQAFVGLEDPMASSFFTYKALAYHHYEGDTDVMDHVIHIHSALVEAQGTWKEWLARRNEAIRYFEAVSHPEQQEALKSIEVDNEFDAPSKNSPAVPPRRERTVRSATVGRAPTGDSSKRGMKRKREPKYKPTAADVNEEREKFQKEQRDCPKWLAETRVKNQAFFSAMQSSMGKRRKVSPSPQPATMHTEHDDDGLPAARPRVKGKRSMIASATAESITEAELQFAATAYQHPSTYSHRGKSKVNGASPFAQEVDPVKKHNSGNRGPNKFKDCTP